MADAKISELTALTTAADADLFAVVDTSATETKKITKADLLGSIVISGGNVGIGAAPSYALDAFKIAGTVARIRNTTASVGTPSTTHGELVIQSSDANMGMQFLGTTTSDQRILFGDAASGGVGQIRYNHSANYMAFSASAAERMRITSAGNVGIGTTAASTALDVHGIITTRAPGGSGTEGGQVDIRNPDNLSTGLTVDVSAADRGRIWQARPNSLMQIGQIASTGGTVTLHTGSSERVRINSVGNVGIGTSAPSARLDVHADAVGGTAGDTSNIFETYHSNGNASYLRIKGVRVSSGTNWTTAGTRIEQKIDSVAQGYIQFNGDGNSATSFGYNNVEKMRMNSGGNFGINTNSPTAKLDVNGSLKLNAGNHATGVGTFAMGNHAGTNYTASTSYSVAVGNEAARYNTANNNVGIGSQALRGVSGSSTGGTNIAIGTNAGRAITSGSASVLAGFLAGHVITTGIGNVILGGSSAPALVNGNNNVCIGNSVATALSSGSLNVFLGVNAGDTTTSGSNCIILGNGAAASSATVSNEITLGNASIAALRCQVTSITALSDMRDKTDITDLDLGLDYINALRPVEFVWAMRDAEDDNPRQGTKEAGFIAQELRSAEDQFGASWLGTVLDTNPDRLEASPGKLLPIVIKALQEASAKIDELNTRIATLEGN